jgi:tripartite-type tricarboxylate transporter receptor subunit TctC
VDADVDAAVDAWGRNAIMPGFARTIGALLALATLFPAPAAAQDDDFYRGKTITIVVPIGPGGAYDAYARLISRHLGRQLPGNPTIVARNMPGAGGVIASNYLYNVAPQDGTAFAIITSSFANEQLFDNPQIKYDARKIFGDRAPARHDVGAVLLAYLADRNAQRHAHEARNHRDLVDQRGAGLSAARHEPLLRRAVESNSGLPVGARLRARGRARRDRWRHQHLLSQLFSGYLREKKLNILVQFALARDPLMPDVPTVIELARDPDAADVFRHLVANDEIGRSLFATPNVPPARLALLRAAFQRMLADADFRAEAAQLKLPLVPKSGEEMQRVIADIFTISPAALGKLQEISK